MRAPRTPAPRFEAVSTFAVLAVAAAALAALSASACGGPAPAVPPSPAPAPVAQAPAVAASAPKPSDGAARPMDRDFIRRMALTRSFRAGAPHGTPTPDGKAVLFLRSGPRDTRQSLFELDVASGATRELLSPEKLLRGGDVVSPAEHARRERMRVIATGFTAIDLARDGARALVTLSGRIFVLTRATGAVVELPTGEGAVIDPRFSPDGRKVAYVRGADLYAIASDGSGREVAVTRGGTETRTHGVAEFIAQEELDRSRGFWWSPDSARLLYEEADTSHVDTWSSTDPAHPEKETERVRYPRPGRPNADVRLGLVSAAGGATTWVDWDRARLPYVANVVWAKEGPLAVYALDRVQKNGELLKVDPATGHTRALVKEHDDAWLNVDPSVPRFLSGGRFLWSSERTGRWELSLHEASGDAPRALTPASILYDDLLDVDEARGVAVVSAREAPSEAAVYAVPLAADAKGGGARALAKVEHGVVDGRFGEGHDLFVTREAAATSALAVYRARRADGSIAAAIPSLVEDPGFVPRVEWTTAGPDKMQVAIVRPRDFDARRRYPIIDAAYGGPHAQVVRAEASNYTREQWIADATGAIVVSIDARGTPGRDRAWERAIDHALATVPLAGHVEALEALARTYPELDASRIGIYGWSFGGYLSALSALVRPDVYKVAVAGAPVTDWRYYDTCYTERYLGLPTGPGDVYAKSSLLELPRPAPNAPVSPLLLIHGTADDNVYLANTLLLADALERAGRPFDLLPLAGVTHMPVDPALAEALWVRVAEYLRAHL